MGLESLVGRLNIDVTSQIATPHRPMAAGMSRRETWVTVLAVVMPTMGHRFQATDSKVRNMFIWALIGGSFTLLALTLLNVGSLISNVFAMLLGLLTLMVMFRIVAAVFKGIVRRWIGVPQQGNSVRMSNSRTVS